MSGRLEGRRVLLTHAERYTGPPVVELFEKEGAHVIDDQSEYADPGTVQEVVDRAGRIDVLVANFAGPPRMMPEMLEDADVREQFVSQIPAGRIGEGEEAAEFVLALATDASDLLAGQVIPGYLIQDGSGGAVSCGRSEPLAGLPSSSRSTL